MTDPRLDNMEHIDLVKFFSDFASDLMNDVRNASYAQAADRMRRMADRIDPRVEQRRVIAAAERSLR